MKKSTVILPAKQRKRLDIRYSDVLEFISRWGEPVKVRKKVMKSRKKAPVKVKYVTPGKSSKLENPEKLRELYWGNEKISMRELAKKLGTSDYELLKAMKKYDIPRRSSIPAKAREILDDPVKLREIYWGNDEPSVLRIGKELGVSGKTVLRKLIEHGIPRRGSNKYRKIEVSYNLDKSVLEDPVKLRELYEKKQMSISMIAESIDSNVSKVHKALKKHSIKRRTLSESVSVSHRKDIPIANELKQLIDGSLIGDAYLSPKVRMSRFEIVSIHPEYINYISSIFRKHGYNVSTNKREPDKYNSVSYRLSTCSSVQLHELRKKWYPDGTKRVPKGLRLTPIGCLHWYLDDGTLRTKDGRITGIAIATQCFSNKENERLVNSLKRAIKWKKGIVITKNNEIYLGKMASLAFLDYMGYKSPVKCFDYKFDPTMKPPKKNKKI